MQVKGSLLRKASKPRKFLDREILIDFEKRQLTIESKKNSNVPKVINFTEFVKVDKTVIDFWLKKDLPKNMPM